MKKNTILSVAITIIGISLLWLGMIYAAGNPLTFRLLGIIVALLGLLMIAFVFRIHFI